MSDPIDPSRLPKHPIVEAMIDKALEDITGMHNAASNNGNPVGESILATMLEAAERDADHLKYGYESITTFRDPASGAQIKIYRKESSIPEYNDVELAQIVGTIPGHASMTEVVRIVGAIKRVTMFELTDAEGNGARVFVTE